MAGMVRSSVIGFLLWKDRNPKKAGDGLLQAELRFMPVIRTLRVDINDSIDPVRGADRV